MTLREIQFSLELAERLDGGDFSTAFVRTGSIHYSGLSARPTAPLKPAHSKRFARFGRHRNTPLRFGSLRLSRAYPPRRLAFVRLRCSMDKTFNSML